MWLGPRVRSLALALHPSRDVVRLYLSVLSHDGDVGVIRETMRWENGTVNGCAEELTTTATTILGVAVQVEVDRGGWCPDLSTLKGGSSSSRDKRSKEDAGVWNGRMAQEARSSLCRVPT